MRRIDIGRTFFIVLVAAAALTARTAAALDPAPYEFRRVGPTLTCTTPELPQDASGMHDCLRMGPLQVGMSLFEVSRELGKPYRVVEQDGATFRVYVISVNAPEGHPLPYWVVGFRDGVVSSLQMTGEKGDRRLAFSSIRLGDSKTHVLQILGEPFLRQDVTDVGAEFWGYSPFPISLEIKEGRVYSIRISDEAGR